MLIDIYSKSRTSSRRALMAAIAVITLIGSYNRLISPHVQYLAASQRYANEVGGFTKKSKMLEGKVKIKQIEVERLSKQVEAAQERIFTVPAAQQFFAGLEILAKENNCSITSLNQLPDDAAGDNKNAGTAGKITTHRASVNMVGSYGGIVNFLQHLFDRPNKIQISPFSISARQDNSDRLECSLILTLYVINDDNGKGADPNAQ